MARVVKDWPQTVWVAAVVVARRCIALTRRWLPPVWRQYVARAAVANAVAAGAQGARVRSSSSYRRLTSGQRRLQRHGRARVIACASIRTVG
jgi:hypothetical protein